MMICISPRSEIMLDFILFRSTFDNSLNSILEGIKDHKNPIQLLDNEKTVKMIGHVFKLLI
jgi:hypothetical protein